jgi:hypothetical protein
MSSNEMLEMSHIRHVITSAPPPPLFEQFVEMAILFQISDLT